MKAKYEDQFYIQTKLNNILPAFSKFFAFKCYLLCTVKLMNSEVLF